MHDPDRHHRRSIRLVGYDYTTAGAYFVTLCAEDRLPLFGAITDGIMQPNDAGRMAVAVWDEIPIFCPGVEIDEFVLMPNHLHGIIVLTGTDPRTAPRPSFPARRGPGNSLGGPPWVRGLSAEVGQGAAPTSNTVGAGPRACPVDTRRLDPAMGRALPALGDIVARYKSMTTKRYIDGVKRAGWPPFPGRVWQRNYYEHIIRNEAELLRIREYIASNPANWPSDKENPYAQ